MAWTKPTFYLTLIFIVIACFTYLAETGDSLINTDRLELNNESIDYIAQLKGISTSNGYSNITSTSVHDTSNEDILGDGENVTISPAADYLASLNIKKERASAPTNYFKIAYNIPTSIIISLGLPIDKFRGLINLIAYLLFISFMIMLWTKLINA